MCKWTHTVKTCGVEGSAVLSWSRGVSSFWGERDYTVALDLFFLPCGWIWQVNVWGPHDLPPAGLFHLLPCCSPGLMIWESLLTLAISGPLAIVCYTYEAVSVSWINVKGMCFLWKPQARSDDTTPPQCLSTVEYSSAVSSVRVFVYVTPEYLYVLGLHASSFHFFHSASWVFPCTLRT